MTAIPVKKELLVWARKLRGLSLEEAAEKLAIPAEELRALENGDTELNLTQFRNYSRKLRIPLGTLLRQTEPPEPPAPVDYRTFEGRPPTVGFETRLAIAYAYTLEQNILELVEANAAEPTPVLPQVKLTEDPAVAGERERLRLGVSTAAQLGWRSDDAFRNWRTIIEAAGPFVLQQKFDLDDCRGFSVFRDRNAPIIMVNKSELLDSAKIFTLVHEYGHILTRQPGLSDLSNGNNVEAFCNRFAGGFLMPRSLLMELLPLWPAEPVRWGVEQIRSWARKLKVSQQSLALRLEQIGVAPVGFYQELVAQQEHRDLTGDGGNHNNTQVSEIGYRYSRAVLAAVSAKKISVAEGSEMLSIAPRYFDQLRERLELQFVNLGAGVDAIHH